MCDIFRLLTQKCLLFQIHPAVQFDRYIYMLMEMYAIQIELAIYINFAQFIREA